jgi:hypothetical protein
MKKLFTAATLFATLLAGCVQFEEPTPAPNPETATETDATRAGEIATYPILQNPYALDNMQAVYDEASVDTLLSPTHLYVRFKPQDAEQLVRLKEEYELDLCEHPIEMDVPDGETYVDPTIQEGELGWYYTGVEVDFAFPYSIPYEILEECYVPAEDETVYSQGAPVQVEMLAYQRTGYSVGGARTRATRKAPEGHIYVAVDDGPPVPLVGIKMNISSSAFQNWIDPIVVYTDVNGYYKSPKRFYDASLKYVITYINREYNFEIWRVSNVNEMSLATFFAAKFMTAKRELRMNHSGGDIVLTTDIHRQNGMAYATAYEYYKMCDETGIVRPPDGLKILLLHGILSGFGSSSALMARRFDLGSGSGSLRDLFIQLIKKELPIGAGNVVDKFEDNGPDLLFNTYDDNDEDGVNDSLLTFREVYNTMHHELSHASHFSQVGVDYWEKYIRYIIKSVSENDDETYGDGTGDYAGNCEVGEMWAYAMGDVNMSEKYNPDRLDDFYVNSSYWNGSLGDSPYYFSHQGANDWLKPDPIWALITRGVLTKKQIFDCLTSDVDTREKLIEKLCSRYPDKEQLIEIAFNANELLYVDVSLSTSNGKSRIYINEPVSFSVPLASSSVIRNAFDGWTISGGVEGNDWQAGDMSGANLGITFLSDGRYTIEANFTPTGSTDVYTVSMSVNVLAMGPPLLYVSDVYYPAGGGRSLIPSKPIEVGNWVRGLDASASVNVLYDGQDFDYWEWSKNGQLLTTPMGSLGLGWYFAPGSSILLSCRVYKEGEAYEWSNVVLIQDGVVVDEDARFDTPVITADKSSVTSGDMVAFTVTNPDDVAYYEWEKNGVVVADERDLTVSLAAAKKSANGTIGGNPSFTRYGSMEVRCRVAGGASEWSEPVVVSVKDNFVIVGPGWQNPGGIWNGGSLTGSVTGPDTSIP